MKHLIFIVWWWPYPADNGSKIRIYNLLRQLSRTYSVTLLAFVNPGEGTPEQIAHLRTFLHAVEIVDKPTYRASSIRATIGYLSQYPRHLEAVFSQDMARLVAGYAPKADMIIGSQLQTLRYLDLVPNLPAMLEELETTCFYGRAEKAANLFSRWRSRLTLIKLQYTIKNLLKRDVALTMVSDLEKDYLERLDVKDARIKVIPNGVDTETLRPSPTLTPEPYTLVYAGSVTYHPNYDAVRFFVRQVLPLVREQYPAVRLAVTGDTGSVDVSDLAAQPGVYFTGYLPEVASVVQSAWTSIVPLRIGGGTRLKILESMALGTPVIATRKGAEGLLVNDGDTILLADSPQDFAAAVIRVLGDADLRHRLALAGRQLVEMLYNWEAIGCQLAQFIEETIEKR